ncbi:MAG TPA: SurA N-terminal domain-containing protein, partial [Syntrophales bacterium]|nr:SurA N-terminal domain-containing protein [Syntrophales bacterium]
MLTFMRKHAKNWMMKAVLGIIIVVFVFYFGSLQSGRQAEVVAMVGDRAITYNDYRQAYDNLLNYYREQFQGALTDDILKSLNL